MSPEERQLLQGLFDRMRNNATAYRDREAEQMIADSVRQQPYAPYFLAQTVIVQDQALQAANERLQQLEQQLSEQQGQSRGGFLSGLFGGGAPAEPPRPVWNQGATGYPQGGAYPQAGGYPPPGGYQQGGGYPPQGGPWSGPQGQPAGGGFLRGALGTAAGVAGGVLMADSIRSLFSGHTGGGLGIASGVPGMAGESIVNNYYGNAGPDGADRAQDAAQDAGNDYNAGGPNAADWAQDADQNQDFAQDFSQDSSDDFA